MTRHNSALEPGPQNCADSSRLPLSLTLCDILAWRASAAADKPALIYQRPPLTGAIVTWSELESGAGRIAAGLVAEGVRPGDRVALFLHDSPGCLATLIAIWRLGAIAVPIDQRWAPVTTGTIIAHAGPVCAVGEQKPSFQLNDPIRFVTFDKLKNAGGGPPPAIAARSDGLAMITYTSGTTSAPKGVMLRHEHLRNAYRIVRDSLFDSAPERIGNVFRTGGLGVLGINYLFAMECGAAVVVLNELGMETARGFWSEVKSNSVDFIYLVPTAVQMITRLSEPVSDHRRILCITGGAPVSEQTHSLFQDRFDHTLRNVYGLTEATCGILWGACGPDGRALRHLGKPPRNLRLRLRDASGRCDDSVTEGELEVSGPIVSDGYWKNSAATRDVICDGWLRTGDIARRDQQGNYSITGRKKDVVIRGGFNIYLEEVDQTLLAHPDVLSACTVGIDNGDCQEELAAMVQVRDGAPATAEGLAVWCRGRIGAFKTPGIIMVTAEDLPRNSSGKVLRAAVQRAVNEFRDHHHS
jgi:long-chain acyl-CoA synthetase